MPTKIEYLDESINPIQDVRKGKSGRGYHCTKCSPGCQYCWAEAINSRFGNGQPFDDTPVQFEIVKSELVKLLKWRKHRYIGIQFMGDLFHEDVPFEFIAAIFGVMSFCQNHTFMILTKRPYRMSKFFSDFHSGEYGRNFQWWLNEACLVLSEEVTRGIRLRPKPDTYPLPNGNIHGALTVCNQEEADEKIPIFLQIPFATHVLSIEPMLGPVDLTSVNVATRHKPLGKSEPFNINALTGDYCFGDDGDYEFGKLDWVIVGGESGPGARPMHPDWVRSCRDQCQEAGVPFFMKQMSKREPIPDDLMIREFPE